LAKEQIRTVARRNAPCVVVMEDLDALIEDENRAFLLNELDGFAVNEGVVVIASTNHPEKLDPAILDRPSRFDRKYRFDPPGLPERLAYVRHWNRALQLDMRLTDAEALAVAERTDRFSFAYLKELFLSSMMEWIGDQTSGGMGEALLKRATVLREQLADRCKEASDAATYKAVTTDMVFSLRNGEMQSS
jgi:SpoVK/Ycf46/Vps4 family AAA+-type ATPase